MLPTSLAVSSTIVSRLDVPVGVQLGPVLVDRAAARPPSASPTFTFEAVP